MNTVVLKDMKGRKQRGSMPLLISEPNFKALAGPSILAIFVVTEPRSDFAEVLDK
jgi:hypothetical protein